MQIRRKKLLAAGVLEDVDCLKVGHHGSRYSTTEAFLEKIKPEVAIISCSSTNTYGHPSPETVERLKEAGSQVEYTMKNGAITVETDGKSLRSEGSGRIEDFFPKPKKNGDF